MQTEWLLAGASRPPDGTAVIRDAHARSAAFGLRAHESSDVAPLTSGDLHEVLDRNRVLHSHALPVMETLHSQIVGTQSLVLLTDAGGTILHALGDDDFVARADRVSLRPGVAWSERYKGTNAVGTALTLGTPVQVHGGQHYLRAHHFLTCSCAPILDPQGRVIGALDVSGDQRSQGKHTLALVRMSAQMVENQLFHKLYENDVLVRFHARPEFLGTLVEGLAAFSPEGRLLSANRSAQFQLGLALDALRMHTFSSLFGSPMGRLLDTGRSAGGDVLALRLASGVQVMARLECRAPVPSVPLPARALRPVAPRPAVSREAVPGLRYLDTGDAQMAQVLARVAKVAGRDVPVLIQGETGTGKEWLARAIHHDRSRRHGPFVAVNCAAIPETLIESELFGYEEGAFTGARRRGAVGRIAQADGGTLFLDEIGDMPLALQARLLRVLQERSVAPLGGGRPVAVDVAVVCATHRNLRSLMAEGRFREDLYYRINGLAVTLPPLRERSDLDVLVARVLTSLDMPVREPVLDPDVMALLRAHGWPGNLRQLASVLRTAVLLAEDDGVVRREHLPEDFLEDMALASRQAGSGRLPPLAAQAAGAVDQALAAHGGNVSAAARALGVSRNKIYRHLRR